MLQTLFLLIGILSFWSSFYIAYIYHDPYFDLIEYLQSGLGKIYILILILGITLLFVNFKIKQKFELADKISICLILISILNLLDLWKHFTPLYLDSYESREEIAPEMEMSASKSVASVVYMPDSAAAAEPNEATSTDPNEATPGWN